MENSKKAVEEVILAEEQLEAVVGGASRILNADALKGVYADALVARRPIAKAAVLAGFQVESAFGKVQVTRLDRISLINTVVAN
ncbi:MAG: hypothetical protein RL685_870 [Pseudomonadota bacterium]|jgi:predicted GNAT superfamily acetyltransferase